MALSDSTIVETPREEIYWGAESRVRQAKRDGPMEGGWCY